MRILSILLFILWLFFGWWLYNDPRDCCNDSSPVEKVIETTDNSSVKTTDITNTHVATVGPLLFNRSNGNPILGANWTLYRDSIVRSLKPNKVLEITGLYESSEKNTSKYENLGLYRANEVAKHFSKYVSKSKFRLLSKLTKNKFASNQFVAASFRGLIDSKNIKQIKDRTLIYFPFNSTNKLNNVEVEKYLISVAKQANETNQKVSLIGHTDNIGSNSANNNLGMRRANIIKDYLIKKGLSPSKIITSSKGEKSPIATNDTDAGRAKNRRTELKLIN